MVTWPSYHGSSPLSDCECGKSLEASQNVNVVPVVQGERGRNSREDG